MPAYFDTNVIRYLRTGLAAQLPIETRRRIAVSPVSVIEVLCQIADRNHGQEALQAVHRFEHWLPEPAVILDWKEPFIARFVFDEEAADEICAIVTEMVNYALRADDVTDTLRNGAEQLRAMTEQGKMAKARLFQAVAERLRAEGLNQQELDARIRAGVAEAVAQSAAVQPNRKSVNEIEQMLVAYFEYHRRTITEAVRNEDYRFDSREHLNNHFDAEQLLYLAIAENDFITCDGGFNRVRQTAQGNRIHIAEANVLSDPATAGPHIQCLVQVLDVARPGEPLAVDDST